MNVLDSVLENVLVTSASLAWHFKVDARTICRDLSVLQTKGFIRQDRPDKGGTLGCYKGIIESFIRKLTRITDITE